MIRSSITVLTKDGSRYSANHLSITYLPSTPGSGSCSALSFNCSGVLHLVPAENVDKILWDVAGATYCSECDGSLHQLVGIGIHSEKA
jgi:hypothetical protein